MGLESPVSNPNGVCGTDPGGSCLRLLRILLVWGQERVYFVTLRVLTDFLGVMCLFVVLGREFIKIQHVQLGMQLNSCIYSLAYDYTVE
jgi:hypothetical protein